MFGGGGSQTTTQKAEPWAPSQPYLMQGMQRADSLYNEGPLKYPDFSTVSPLGGTTVDALNRVTDRATSGSPVNAAASDTLQNILGGAYKPNTATINSIAGAYNPATKLISNLATGGGPEFSGNDQLSKVAAGDYLNAGNPYLDANVKRATDTVRDYTNAAFSNAGRVGSHAYQDTLAKNVGDVASQMYGANYAAERGRQDSAASALNSTAAQGFGQKLQAAGVLGDTYGQDFNRQLSAGQSIANIDQTMNQNRLAGIGLSPQIANTDYADLDALFKAGGITDAQAQKLLDDQVARYNFNQQAPWDMLNRYNAIIQGFGGLGGTTTGTQPRQDQTGSILGGLGSLASAAAIFSDGRLKANITPAGRDEAGRAWYTYNYVWDAPDVRRRGVIAQEIIASDPEAVSLHPSGYLMVDYSKLARH